MKKEIPIPVSFVNMDEAKEAWSEFQVLVLQEAEIKRKRIDAHKRFMAAYTGVPE